ncbi:MAG: UvrD-helicase domain-containing protein [Deltaproteobacteria bacterium]|jgi:DNA helicase-2/ATP-dependent DNA helicase PcrA|nr:UvrD-helicase domain-containing protein [Deltaproteobacteria bacterium]
MDHLSDLNQDQIEAVTATEGAVRVIAGPGTGKTRTLTRRYAYLVDTLGVSPANILCATFTNKAANEMKKRIRERLGDLDLGYISTIHSFCLRLLKEDINVLEYPKNFIILDNNDQIDIMDQVFEEMNLKMSDLTIKTALDTIIETKKLFSYSYIGNFNLLNNETLKEKYLNTVDTAEGIFLRYLYKQKQSYGLDFNDLINFASYILENFSEVLNKWQKRLQYVMVDEFQDVSKRQYKLMALLAGYHKNLFIVGDPDQTIYTWRGSQVRQFLDFTKVHRPSISLSLPTNYRSSDQIIVASSSLIEHNQERLPYRQVGLKPDGLKPKYFRAKNHYHEADFVAWRVKKLLGKGLSADQIAIIYRAHHFSRTIEEKFIREKIAYRLYSGTAFYGRKEIKDMISYLRMLTSADDMSFRRVIRVPTKGIGKKTLALIAKQAERQNTGLYQALKGMLDQPQLAKTGAYKFVAVIEKLKSQVGQLSLIDLFQKLLDDSGYEAYLRLQGDQERLDNAAELKRAVADFGKDPEASLEDFLAQAALFTDLDHDHPEKTVKLMTIHAAKGLEFEVVFLIGLAEGSLPSSRADTPEELTEERRLCYVAMTRARSLLFLSNSSGRSHEGTFQHTSRFVYEMGLNNLELLTHPGTPPSAYHPSGNPITLTPFSQGQRITHPAWGPGTILTLSEKEFSYQVQFDRFETPRNLRFDAPLSPADLPAPGLPTIAPSPPAPAPSPANPNSPNSPSAPTSPGLPNVTLVKFNQKPTDK